MCVPIACTSTADRLDWKKLGIALSMMLLNIYQLFLISQRFESWEVLITHDNILGLWGAISVPLFSVC
jgi:hypothetical protein